ncbi:MAG: hypothetical protein SGILL_010789, partial [Bacillariaceae sp.]
MSHLSPSASHPSNTSKASNVFHETAPTLAAGTKRTHDGDVASHGGQTGFDFACTLIFSPLFLRVKSGDIFLDAGGGIGSTAIACKLVNRNVRAVSVEIEKTRHKAATTWVGKIQWEPPTRGLTKTPELINDCFLDDKLDDEIWKKPRLRVYFNNFGMAFAARNPKGTQYKLETKMTKLCHPGTVVVTLDRMFINNLIWKEEIFTTYASPVDLDWLAGPRSVSIFKYTREDPRLDSTGTGRRSKRQAVAVEILRSKSVLGAAPLQGTTWEECYGIQTYPVKIDTIKDKLQFMVEEPWLQSNSGFISGFEPDPVAHDRDVIPIYYDGAFNAARFLKHVYDIFPRIEKRDQALLFLKRWVYMFTEMSLMSHGASEHLKRSCSYVRPTRFLLSALTALDSKAVYEFGAGKGILFALLQMYRQLHGFNVECDVAVDSKTEIVDWASFEDGELSTLVKEELVWYQDSQDECHSVEAFTERFRKWRCEVANMTDDEDLSPEMLLLSWPRTDDRYFMMCVSGWYKAGGERLAVIYDPVDREACVPGPFMEEVPGGNWKVMKNVLHENEGGVKTYNTHMPLMPWGSSSREHDHGANHSYGLYIFERIDEGDDDVME